MLCWQAASNVSSSRLCVCCLKQATSSYLRHFYSFKIYTGFCNYDFLALHCLLYLGLTLQTPPTFMHSASHPFVRHILSPYLAGTLDTNHNLTASMQLLGNSIKLLAKAELLMANVLTPECTDGLLYDALYCDMAVGEEDLPALLALLHASGRLVVVLEEVSCFSTVPVNAATCINFNIHQFCGRRGVCVCAHLFLFPVVSPLHPAVLKLCPTMPCYCLAPCKLRRVTSYCAW